MNPHQKIQNDRSSTPLDPFLWTIGSRAKMNGRLKLTPRSLFSLCPQFSDFLPLLFIIFPDIIVV
jgi:hypothetical protein